MSLKLMFPLFTAPAMPPTLLPEAMRPITPVSAPGIRFVKSSTFKEPFS